MLTPRLLLDVDGVLNAGYPVGWPTKRREHVYSESDRCEYRITWSPALADALIDMHIARVVEIVWCTTWCSEAHVIEELLGWPELERAIDVCPTPKGLECHRLKLAAVNRELSRGPIIWADDEINLMATGRERDALREAGALLITPIGKAGLNPDHLAEIERFSTTLRTA